MSKKPNLPWRRRQEKLAQATATKTLWARVWASRSAWTLVGGAVVFVLTHGVESLSNLRKLPSEAVQTYYSFQSWYYDDAKWTGTWSSREEGHIEDYRQSDVPLKLTVGTERGVVYGEMFNRSVCEQNPLLPPILVEGEISRGKLLAYAFAYVGGERQYLYSFQARRSDGEPVITVTPIKDPSGLLPASARLLQRMGDSVAAAPPPAEREAEHHDLVCPESPSEFLQRLRKEGKLKGLDQLSKATETDEENR